MKDCKNKNCAFYDLCKKAEFEEKEIPGGCFEQAN